MFFRAIAGPPPSGLAPVITIHDEEQREILLLGIDGSDFVMRQYLRATALGFETPSQVLRGRLDGLDVGERFDATVTTDGPWHNVAVAGHPPAPIGWTPGRSWALLGPLSQLPERAAQALDVCWIALLVFPASFWARRRPLCWLGIAAFFVVAAALPLFGTVGALPMREWGAAVVAAAAGFFCARLADDQMESRANPKEFPANSSPNQRRKDIF
jgi:hypothetical protein